MNEFNNACTKALSAVLYLRVLLEGKSIESIMATKTKVASIRTITVPRLELCASHLLAKFASHIYETLHLEECPLYL